VGGRSRRAEEGGGRRACRLVGGGAGAKRAPPRSVRYKLSVTRSSNLVVFHWPRHRGLKPHHGVMGACCSSGHGPNINSSHESQSMTAAQYVKVQHRPCPEFHFACFSIHRANGQPPSVSPPVPNLVAYRTFLTLRDLAFLIRHFP